MFVLFCDVEFAQQSASSEYYACVGSMPIPGRIWLALSVGLTHVQQTQHATCSCYRQF